MRSRSERKKLGQLTIQVFMLLVYSEISSFIFLDRGKKNNEILFCESNKKEITSTEREERERERPS